MKRIIVLMAVASGLGILLSCEKAREEYPGGGFLEESGTNILKNWELKQYLRNEQDETNTIYISGYEENYSDPEEYIRNYLNSTEETVADSGRYSFSDDQRTLHISDVSSIEDFSEAHTTLSSATYNIVRLTGSEYWYSFENGGDNHEFRFTAK